MPTPDVIYIPCPYPWKRTYCGSELVYDPTMCDSENDCGEQSAGDAAGAIKSEPTSPVKEPASLVFDDADYVVVNPEQGERASSPDYSAGSPAPAPVPPCDEVGIERMPSESFEVGRTGSVADERPGSGSVADERTGSVSVADERTGSVSVGRTGSDAAGSGCKTPDAYTLPDVKIKLERFSPRKAKAAVREDSVPLDEEPRKRVRFESPVAETCQA